MRGLQSQAACSYGIEAERRYGRTFIVTAVEGQSGARASLVFATGMKESAAQAVLIGCCAERDLASGRAWADLVVRASALDGSYFDESGDLE